MDFRIFETIEGGRFAVRLDDVLCVCGFSDATSIVKLRDGSEVEVKHSVALIVGAQRGPDDPLAFWFLPGRARTACLRLGLEAPTPAEVAAKGIRVFEETKGVGMTTCRELTEWLRRFGTDWQRLEA